MNWKNMNWKEKKKDDGEMDIDPFLDIDECTPFYFYIHHRKNKNWVVDTIVKKGNEDTRKRLKRIEEKGTALAPQEQKAVKKTAFTDKILTKLVKRLEKKGKKEGIEPKDIKKSVEDLKFEWKLKKESMESVVNFKFLIWYERITDECVKETIFSSALPKHLAIKTLKPIHELYWKAKDRTSKILVELPNEVEVGKYRSQDKWKPIL